MNCPKCGEVCSCIMEPSRSVVPDDIGSAEMQPVSSQGSDATEWRDELASRLNRYRARRKAPPPRYPSLRLPFERVEAAGRPCPPSEKPSVRAFEPVSNQALALDGMQQLPPLPPEPGYQTPAASDYAPTRVAIHSAPPPTAKIIEFPRFAWAPPPPNLDQLAEPVMDRPRILDVPDVVPPGPALGGITIEPIAVAEPEKRLGIDVPLQSAPLGRRLAAALTDGLIVSIAAGLFGLIFWKVAEIRPPRLQVLELSAGLLFMFWAAYQYLLVVHSARTPGLLLARLELAHFNGTPARRSVRRWRVLASFLSALSLGMGYVWLFLDEDSLCWHDRITRTYLAPRKVDTKNKPQP